MSPPHCRDPKFGNTENQDRRQRMGRMSSPGEDSQPWQPPQPMEGKKKLMLILGFLLLVFGFPLIIENRSSECSALESKLVTLNATSAGQLMVVDTLQGLSNGAIANAALEKKYPLIPTPISCAYAYWNVTFGGAPP